LAELAEVSQVDAGDWIAVVSAVAAIATIIVAGMALRTSRLNLTYHHLSELMKEYAEPAMDEAIKELWDFLKRQNGDPEKLKGAFTEMLGDSPGGSLNSARRRISHFYQRMAALYAGRLLPKKVLYRIWYEPTLRIIPKVIVPLEEALYLHLRGRPPEHEFDFLRRLYSDSLDQ
jgi:hypothetical protein